MAIVLAALQQRKRRGGCVKEVQSLEDVLAATGYEIIHVSLYFFDIFRLLHIKVKDREDTPIPLRCEHFEQTKDFITQAIDQIDKKDTPLTGVLIWIM